MLDTSDVKLAQSVPDTGPASGGMQALAPENQRRLGELFNIKSNADYVKHLSVLHDGELRRVCEERWEVFPATGGMLHKACFWQYQFATQVVASSQDMRVREFVSTNEFKRGVLLFSSAVTMQVLDLMFQW